MALSSDICAAMRCEKQCSATWMPNKMNIGDSRERNHQNAEQSGHRLWSGQREVQQVFSRCSQGRRHRLELQTVCLSPNGVCEPERQSHTTRGPGGVVEYGAGLPHVQSPIKIVLVKVSKITTHHVSLESNDPVPPYVINGGMNGDQGVGIT